MRLEIVVFYLNVQIMIMLTIWTAMLLARLPSLRIHRNPPW